MKIIELLLGFMLKVAFWVMVQTANFASAVIGFIVSALWNWWQARRAMPRPVYQAPRGAVQRHRHRRRHHGKR